MSNTARGYNEDDSKQNPETTSGLDGHDTPRPEDVAFGTIPDPPVQEGDCLDRARKLYGSLGVPDEIIRQVSAVMVAHEMRLSPRCDTAKKEAMCKEWLVGATEMALAALVMQMPTPIHITTILAKAIRDLAPDEYNAWADLQLSSSVSLAMVVAMRDFTDLPRERLIEDNLEKGHLAAGAVSLLSNQMLNLIGILRPKLESELGVKTTDEQLDLDLALDAFLMARRIKAMGESLVGSIPKYSNVTKGLKLIDEAERHDNLFQTRLDKLRTRIQKRARKIKVGARTNVPIKVGAPTTEEPPQAEVASA